MVATTEANSSGASVRKHPTCCCGKKHRCRSATGRYSAVAGYGLEGWLGLQRRRLEVALVGIILQVDSYRQAQGMRDTMAIDVNYCWNQNVFSLAEPYHQMGHVDALSHLRHNDIYDRK
jgi:hypothetical protein